MENEQLEFEFEKKTVRAAWIDGELNFCLSDVYLCLFLANPANAARQIRMKFKIDKLNQSLATAKDGVCRLCNFVTVEQLKFMLSICQSGKRVVFGAWLENVIRDPASANKAKKDEGDKGRAHKEVAKQPEASQFSTAFEDLIVQIVAERFNLTPLSKA